MTTLSIPGLDVVSVYFRDQPSDPAFTFWTPQGNPSEIAAEAAEAFSGRHSDLIPNPDATGWNGRALRDGDAIDVSGSWFTVDATGLIHY